MVDKSGGDIYQTNLAQQGNESDQSTVAAGPGGAGILEGTGGDALANAMAQDAVTQALNQASHAVSGEGGDDNINANTTINIG